MVQIEALEQFSGGTQLSTLAVRSGIGAWATGAARAWNNPLNDCTIRRALRTLLNYDHSAARGRVLEELALNYGAVRADIVVSTADTLHIYEIKSDLDRLDRLPEQARVYAQTSDYATLVVGWRHAVAAMRQAPSWWEVWLAEWTESGGIQFVPLRPLRINPECHRPGLTRLLPRSDALSLLAVYQADRGVRTKPRAVIYGRLMEVVSLDVIRAHVHQHLRSRQPRVGPRPL